MRGVCFVLFHKIVAPSGLSKVYFQVFPVVFAAEVFLTAGLVPAYD